MALSQADARKLVKSHHHLLSTPNVVSISYCDEKKDGKKTGRKVLCFGVVKKLQPKHIAKPDVLLPKSVSFENENKKVVEIPVQVVEDGEIVSLATYKRESQVKTEGINASGSLGVNTQYKGHYRLLSGAHVLTEFKDANIGKKIYARHEPVDAFEDTGATVTGHVAVSLYDTNTEANPTLAKQDLAWADVTVQQGDSKIKDIGNVGTIRDPVLNEKVQFYGGMSEELQDDMEVIDISTTAIVKFNIGGATKYGYFEEVVKIDLDAALPLSGDSGSAVIAKSDNKIVGIMMSMGMLYGYFTKLTF